MRRLLFITAICALWVGFFSSRPSFSKEMDKESDRAQQAYRAYVKAWKLKDIPALEETISDDYMAVNLRGKVSDKKNEIATVKEDAEWTSMTVDEIHTRIFGDTAIDSGFISAQGKTKYGNIISTRVLNFSHSEQISSIWLQFLFGRTA